MAKRAMKSEKAEKGPNKAKAIRDYAKENKKAGPKEIAAAMQALGLDVSPAYVSTIRTLAKKSKGKGKRGPKAAASTEAAPSNSEFLSVLIKAKKLAEQLGGVDQAKSALDALAKLGA